LVAVVLLSVGTDSILHATKIYPLWGERMSDGLFLLATAYRIIYAIAGSYIAAKLAPGKPFKHALMLGVIGFVLSIAGALAALSAGPELGPLWYPLALVVTALPCAWVGGRLAVDPTRSNSTPY
jgi:surface polysaccharide O-acyltransferase-like enzyme